MAVRVRKLDIAVNGETEIGSLSDLVVRTVGASTVLRSRVGAPHADAVPTNILSVGLASLSMASTLARTLLTWLDQRGGDRVLTISGRGAAMEVHAGLDADTVASGLLDLLLPNTDQAGSQHTGEMTISRAAAQH